MPDTTRRCVFCGLLLAENAHPQRKYCDNRCKLAAHEAVPPPPVPLSSPVEFATCERCQRSFRKKSKVHKMCSDQCRRIPRICRRCGAAREQFCSYCAACQRAIRAEWIVRVKLRSKEVRQEARRAGHRNSDAHRKRARQYGVEYDPKVKRLAVLERDDWVCWICTKPIPNIMWNHAACDLYGTVDHVVEFCRGGSHTWSNVRAAHHRCNWERSAGIKAA